MKLECIQIACGYEKKTVLKDISMSLSSGEMLCILGPNGVGKTTILRTMLGFLPLHSGSIFLDEEDICKWSKRKLAKAIAYVPQAHITPFPFLVGDVVLMGRNAHLGHFASPSSEDKRIAYESLERLGIAGLKNMPYTEISGGERQLVLVARALAQETELLLLDEPTSNLDYGNQIRVLEQIRNIVHAGIGVLMTTHSPNHAFLCATRVALLGPEKSLAIGSPTEILTEKNLFCI
jgi:iron complex transport system ATP-binding protein